MRKIKFRMWDKNNMKNKMMYSETEVFDDMIGFRFEHFDGDSEDLILMQWTGMKDESGKDIYEGDIVSTTSMHPGESPFEITGVVKFLEGTWVIDDGTKLVKLWSETIEKEVIGNKFENPEMNFIIQKNAQHSKLINPLKQFSYDLKKILGE